MIVYHFGVRYYCTYPLKTPAGIVFIVLFYNSIEIFDARGLSNAPRLMDEIRFSFKYIAILSVELDLNAPEGIEVI